MPNTKSVRFSAQERALRRAQDREYARQAVERLRSSEGWQQWLATRARFHSYSLANQLLIALQHPTATRVAGFRAWLKLGYCVKKGEKAIRIWAPCPPSAKQIQAWRNNGQIAEEMPRTHFKLAAVFDTLSRVCVRRGRGPSAEGMGGLVVTRGRRGAGARRATAQRRSRAARSPGDGPLSGSFAIELWVMAFCVDETSSGCRWRGSAGRLFCPVVG